MLVCQVKVDTFKLSDANDIVTWSHQKQKSENDYCSVCSWPRSKLELNLFINKWQNGGLWKKKKQIVMIFLPKVRHFVI